MIALVIKTGVDGIMKAGISGKEYVGLALVALEFSPKKLYANLGGNGSSMAISLP